MGDNFVQETGAFLTAAKASFSELDDSWKEMKTRVRFYVTLEGIRDLVKICSSFLCVLLL